MKLLQKPVSAAALMLATMGGSALADSYSWPIIFHRRRRTS